MYTLLDSINFSQTFIEYAPLNAGTNYEPALSIASMVRNTIMNAPFTWPWNRNEYLINTPNTPAALTAEVQDYTFTITDFAYLEKISLLSADGTFGYELKDVYNTNILGIPALTTNESAQPNAAAVRYYIPGTSVAIRFLPPPDQAYTGIITYQKLPNQFQIYNFSSVTPISNGLAMYEFTNTMTPAPTYLVGQDILVQGFDQTVDNGTFTCTAATGSFLTLANANAVLDVHAGTGINIDWFPIPDSYKDIFNNLFLAESMAFVDDAREQVYRLRGISALLSKAEGLNEMQRNAFLAQYLSRLTNQELAAQLRTQMGSQSRGV